MKRFSHPITDPNFVQNPYPVYDELRSLGELVYWDALSMPVAAGYDTVNALLRNRNLGREPLQPQVVPDRLRPFYDVEAHSILELEPPRHTALRGQLLRAFTSRVIAQLEPEITTLCHALIDDFPTGPFDLLDAYCRPLPVRVIARFMGVPEDDAPDLLTWSNAMVRMYQTHRTRVDEDKAVAATLAFKAYLSEHISTKRRAPGTDMISTLIIADEMSQDELIATCILLLNAGHEATVHTLGNAINTLLQTDIRPDGNPGFTEEALRHDPPLHLFTRYVYEPVEIDSETLQRGDQVGLLLGAANRDPRAFPNPEAFIPTRHKPPVLSFGAGLHFCIGAPLARLEITAALTTLFDRKPKLSAVQSAHYADIWHFHGLEDLKVTATP